MANIEVLRSPFLFLADGQQQTFARDFGKNPNVFAWIRPCVYFHPFTDALSRLQYVSEYAYWEGNDPIPPFWGVELRATGNTQFVMLLMLVTV
ncbi:hypothetical protein ACIBK8_13455 [Streptomyces sp. NPDC050161]|uniref:hypothetical protein n=1 Tax=unclassified Streptomyces TaxID=2593676 RepID=UPI0037139DF3